MDLVQQLFERLDKNLADYHAHLMGFDRQEIIEMASRVAVMSDAIFYLQNHHTFEDGQIEYLLQFQNPLEVVADKWQDRTEDISDMSFSLHEVFDKQDALQGGYPLISEAEKPLANHLRKFVDVDVTATLGAIARQSIVHFPKDFEYDKDILRRAAASDNPEDKSLLWHVSAYGTHTMTERDAFVEGTGAHSTWVNYHYPDMLGYAVEITGMENGTVKGTVCELNHQEHMAHVQKTALPAETVTISYKDGRETTVSRREFDDDRHRLMSESGNVTGLRFHPEDESVLANLLRREQRHRAETPKGNFKPHLKSLDDNRVQSEARRIVTAFQAKTEPDSPNKTHFMEKLSYEFAFLASTEDQNRLMAALPYKSLSLSGLKGEKGVFAFISKDENRDQPVKEKKPSIRAQLQEAAKEVKPRPAPETEKSRPDKGAR